VDGLVQGGWISSRWMDYFKVDGLVQGGWMDWLEVDGLVQGGWITFKVDLPRGVEPI